MELHLLDMGTEKYGDCILITHDGRTILIDGAHPGDESDIKAQLKLLLKKKPPFIIDLLVVTHCHSDHVGCLPAMVALKYIKPRRALLADPALRWADVDVNDDAFYSDENILAQALQEEGRSDLNDEELAKFLSDAVDVGPDYKKMIQDLTESGTAVQLYRGNNNDHADIIEEFADFGLQILGPTAEHLNICAQDLTAMADTAALADLIQSADTDVTLVDLYRQLTDRFSDDSEELLQDGKNNGAAVNDQSIVLKVHADGWSALLAGDMQWASSGVTGLSVHMKNLLEEVNKEGPYDFIKLTHHTAANGLNAAMLNNWIQTTKLYGHTGGSIDKGHPNAGVLKLLKEKKNEKILFGRTDKNGTISVAKSNKDQLTMYISKGDFNDFSPNKISDVVSPSVLERPKIPKAISPSVTESEAGSTQNFSDDSFVEVITKVPHTSTKVTITIDIDPKKKSSSQKVVDVSPSPTLSSSRFANLLFVTCLPLLAANIGQAESEKAIELIKDVFKANLIDIKPVATAREAFAQISPGLTKSTRGVVIVGGYDVVPASQLDVLDEDLRKEIMDDGYDNFDADNFVVWSDDMYGDLDNDSFPELPVSRIPDGKSAELVFAALMAPDFTGNFKFGIRNLARPFAVDIYEKIAAANKYDLEVSEQCSPTKIELDRAQGAVYYMLHGALQDATRFWGETSGGATYEAFDIDNIPNSTPGSVIFAGCCWGALTVQPAAYRYNSTIKLRPRTPEQSIPLSYLKAGALAYIGCTGTHYSPHISPFTFFGKPMHDSFWKGINGGDPPALALFKAKEQYAYDLPHGQGKSFAKAIEVKILREFTCLGLGW